MKLGHMAAMALWGLGVVVAVASMVLLPGEDTDRAVAVLLLSLGFLAMTIWVARNEWLLNDKGIWDKLRRAIEKDKPELASRCIRTALRDGSQTCKDDIASCLQMALQKERWQVATAMLNAGAANPAILNPPHFFALGVLEQCVADGNLQAIRLLLEHGASPDAGTGYPPLLDALARGRLDIAELLLAHGASPQGAHPDFNPDRLTALHLLCSYRQATDVAADIRIADRLLLEGADVNARTLSGFTPLDVAMDSRFSTGAAHQELLDFLRARGATRGALLSVPQASFSARVLMKGKPIELPAESHGCELQRAEADRAAPVAHDWQVLLLCRNSAGELPLAAGFRLARAVQELCCWGEQAVAADLGRGFIPATELADAEQPLLCMLRLQPCSTEAQTGLETEGMSRFGLPELRAVDTPSTPREWLVFAIRHVVESFIERNACPVVKPHIAVGEMDDDDIWSADEIFTLHPCSRLFGEGPCLEISNNRY